MSKKKLITLLLALTMILSLATGASAAETTEARVPVTLTVVNTVAPISCTVPAALPVSLVDGYVVCANNAAITNTGKTGAIRVTKVDVQAGTFEIGSYDDFSASKNSIAAPKTGYTSERKPQPCAEFHTAAKKRRLPNGKELDNHDRINGKQKGRADRHRTCRNELCIRRSESGNL